MQIATSHSTAADSAKAAQEAANHLIDKLGVKPDILYASWSSTYDGAVLIRMLGSLLPGCKIHGSTSCLGGMTEQGFISEDGNGLILMGISDPAGAYGVGGAEMGQSPREAATQALQQALQDAGRPGEMPAMVRLSAAPGSEEEVIAGLEDLLGQDVPIIGGSAADNTVSGNWQESANSQIYTNSVVVSVLFPSVGISYAFHSGYSPTEVKGKVTAASNRLLQQIDGKPAAVVYNEWTQGAIAPALDKGGNVLASTTLFPLGRVVGEVGGVPYFRLSHPDGVTPEGGLTLFSDIHEGENLVLMTGSIDSLVARAGRVAQSALNASKLSADDISGAMVVYCAGCMLTVKDEMPRVVAELNHALGGKPLFGTFTFGEQGCFVGGENRHGNLMISVVVFGK